MIRPATIEDTPDMIQLLKDCDLYNPNLDYQEWSHPTLVCDASGVIVGLVQVILGRPYCYMTEICVHPDWQNRGIASQMIQYMEETLKALGMKAWCGLAVEENENSQMRMSHLGGLETKRCVAMMKVIL